MPTYNAAITVVSDQLDLAQSNLLAKTSDLIAKAALDTETLAKLAISTDPKTGLIYKRSGAPHQASAPGEAPADPVGDLVKSIQSHASGLDAEVTVDSDIAVYLEFGTAHMGPRPFLTPAADQAAEVFSTDIAKMRLLDD